MLQVNQRKKSISSETKTRQASWFRMYCHAPKRVWYYKFIAHFGGRHDDLFNPKNIFCIITYVIDTTN